MSNHGTLCVKRLCIKREALCVKHGALLPHIKYHVVHALLPASNMELFVSNVFVSNHGTNGTMAGLKRAPSSNASGSRGSPGIYYMFGG